MVPPVVTSGTVHSEVLLLGQAPGAHEGEAGKPFAWTAGKTLFKWFASIGLNEEEFRSKVYMAAVCRCFPGKAASGGDRVPDQDEIETCSDWLEKEIEILGPKLVIPVGKLAITQLMEFGVLKEVVGNQYEVEWRRHKFDVIPLPHPSGASTWHRTSPGKGLLAKALKLIKQHRSYSSLLT
jgi:uracil-DNA glycosylase